MSPFPKGHPFRGYPTLDPQPHLSSGFLAPPNQMRLRRGGRRQRAGGWALSGAGAKTRLAIPFQTIRQMVRAGDTAASHLVFGAWFWCGVVLSFRRLFLSLFWFSEVLKNKKCCMVGRSRLNQIHCGGARKAARCCQHPGSKRAQEPKYSFGWGGGPFICCACFLWKRKME